MLGVMLEELEAIRVHSVVDGEVIVSSCEGTTRPIFVSRVEGDEHVIDHIINID
jgi:hypothetical protein